MIMDNIGTIPWYNSKMDNIQGFVSDGADEYIKLHDINEVILHVCLIEKCMPEKHKNIRKFTKRRLLLYSRIPECSHRNKKPL